MTLPNIKGEVIFYYSYLKMNINLKFTGNTHIVNNRDVLCIGRQNNVYQFLKKRGEFYL